MGGARVIAVAWQTLRARRAGFLGSFLALALGVGLFAAAGLILAAALRGPDGPPRWYIAPSVVVAGPDRGGVTPNDPDGRFNPALPAGERGFVPAGVVAALAGIDDVSAVVVEHVSYAQFGPATEAHPWAASALHPFTFVAGGPPADADHVVLTAPTGTRVGEVVTVATVDGPRRFTVSGIIETPAEPALYLSDDVAARLAGDRVAAVALVPAPGAESAALAGDIRGALGDFPTIRVLTGDDRRGAELDAEAGLYVAVTSLAGSVAGLAGFVAVYIVAGTFAFTVTQRRREFALLRAAGATPRQVRRLVLSEAVLVGAPAGLAGIVVGAAGAPAAARWLAGHGLAPTGFRTGLVWWPLAAAFALGLAVAVAAAWLAARRAGRIRPVEAIGEAAVDRRGAAVTVVRWVLGTACLGSTVPVTRLMSGPAGAAYLLVVVMLLILGATLLLPVLMRPVNRLATAGRGPIAMLARANTRTGSRRYASSIAPVLVTVGLAGGALAGTSTITTTEAAGLRHHLTAPITVIPAGKARLPSTTTDRLRSLPGVAGAAPVKATTVFDHLDGMVRERSAWYVDGAAVSQVLRLPLAAGSFDDLTDGAVAVSASMADRHGWHTDETVTLWMGDGATAELRIAAIVGDRLGLPAVFLPWGLAKAHSTTPTPDTVYLTLTPHADATAIDAAVAPLGATLTDTGSHLATLDEQFDRLSRLSLLAMLGVALVYTAIAIANTQLITTSDRVRELRALREVGATRHQIMSLVRREGFTVAATGTVLGCVVTASTLLAVHVSLRTVTESVHPRVPWLTILAVAASCTAITLTAGIAPARRALRETAATRRQ
jgi:putative ABC transport system permease protein